MKLHFSFFVIFGLSAGMVLQSEPLFGQKKREENLFKGMVSAGFQLSQIDGDGPMGYNYPGANAGAGVLIYAYKDLISTSIEINYSGRGSTTKLTVLSNGACSFRQRTDYIEVPIGINVHDKNLLFGHVSLVPGVLMNSTLRYQFLEQLGNPEPPSCLTNNIGRFDLSIRGGFYFLIKQRFGLGAQISYSIVSLRPACQGYSRAKGQFHNVVGIKAFYLIYGNSNKEK